MDLTIDLKNLEEPSLTYYDLMENINARLMLAHRSFFLFLPINNIEKLIQKKAIQSSYPDRDSIIR